MRIISKETIHSHQDRAEDNIILIDKPEGWSSFDVVKKIRYLTRIKKVGHAGTLDPFASGLLIIGTGRQTKSLTGISQAVKEYLAGVELGKSTDTFDITGNRYDLIINIKFLNRRLFPLIAKGLREGGVLIFQTFLDSGHPVSKKSMLREYMLRKNELIRAFSCLEVIYYQEDTGDRNAENPGLASLVAVK